VERKTCLITGASGEIGEQVTRQLMDGGWQVILHCHQNKEKLQNLIRECKSDRILGIIQADLTTKEGIESLLSQLFIPVQAYVHASGNAMYKVFQETSDEEMEKMLHLHVFAPWKISQFVLPSMIQNQRGKIILISSIWGEVGASYEVIYSSVKGAQNSFVKALAKEVGPSNIQVNAVSPGFIQTKMNSHLSDEEIDEIKDNIPAKRLGTPRDVASVVEFLMDDDASYINGQIIGINGGWF
jgi:3-oxoacyl-[acyl-carrier protein] reductase